MTEPAGALAATPSAPRVLILDDSRFDVELLTEALAVAFPSARACAVRDERGFVEALNDGHYALILSDYELPGFSGAHALEMARRMAPQTPFVFVSGVIGEDNAVELLKITGLEVLQEVRANAALRSIPVVMLTSSQEESDVVRSYELGVNAYVVKPVAFDRFVSAIADLGVFWAVLNEPPPGSLKAVRQHD